MKWRIVLTVLFVLTLFSGFAYLYVNAFVRKHQHAVILFVVPGLDLNLLNLARQQLGRSAQLDEPDDPVIGDARRRAAYRSAKLNLDGFWDVAMLSVQEPGRPVPDAGVDATALACGKRVQNGYVSIDSSNEPLRSLIYAAEQSRRATGLVTTSSLVEPTPVAFYSNNNGQPDPDRNANDLLYSGIDIILGGGSASCLPATVENEKGRHDNRNLFTEAKARGYEVVRTREELNNVTTWRTREVFGVFTPGPFYFSSLAPEHAQPSLAEMTRVAISSLNYSINGYFLVVEHGLVARAAEQNFTQLGINEVAEVDAAIESAVQYAGPDALVMVTNSYSLGAVSPALPSAPGDLTAVAPQADLGPHAPATNAPPAVASWQSGPGGPPINHPQIVWLKQNYDSGWFSTNAPGALQPQAALRFQPTALPTAEPAWIAARGEGSAQLRGFINNTDIFDIVSEQF